MSCLHPNRNNAGDHQVRNHTAVILLQVIGIFYGIAIAILLGWLPMHSASMPQCRFVQSLKELAIHSEAKGTHGLSYVAEAALKIVIDIHHEYMADGDLSCLADLVKEFRQEGYDHLFVHLHDNAPDCAICAALARRLGMAAA